MKNKEIAAMDLFPDRQNGKPAHPPLAARLRPRNLGEMLGQDHLLGREGILTRSLEEGKIPSAIFWGPPGTGKTTCAFLLAESIEADFRALSAVMSGVKELREILAQAERAAARGRSTMLFIDEIHRYNKAQQDALLHAVEDGTVIMIGATTENPSFEVIGPLLSRCLVFRFDSLTPEALEKILLRALTQDEEVKDQNVILSEAARQYLFAHAAGDARRLLNVLEITASLVKPDQEGRRKIQPEDIDRTLQSRSYLYDKQGDAHYDTISAFIKSVRASDPDAAIYYMTRMLEAGEDPLFIARRLIVLASEDIGNAAPNAIVIAASAFQAVHQIGMPEAAIVLAQTTTYLASCPKSNASYVALMEAKDDLKRGGVQPVPLTLRNPVTRLMQNEGYGRNYQYAHDYEG
ncbi:MAG: replication-associated recombination protein A, partial [bacterium]